MNTSATTFSLARAGFLPKPDNDVGGFDTAVGQGAGEALVLGYHDSLFGANVGSLLVGSNDTALGANTLETATTASKDTAVGISSFEHCSTCEEVTGVGLTAGEQDKAGNDDTFVGSEAGRYGTNVNHDTAVGIDALQGKQNETEQRGYNTAEGYAAGRSLYAGERNVFLGGEACPVATSVFGDTCIGWQAGGSNTHSDNVFLGEGAGYENASGEGVVDIGRDAGYKGTGSNELDIADSTTTEPLVQGTFPNSSLRLNATEIGFFKHVVSKQLTAIGELTPSTATAKQDAEKINSILKGLEKLGLME